MLGAPDSCGVWAPCLTHADGLFHLIYTDVKRYGRTTVGGASGASLRDFHNYLVTCETIDGDWSDPVFLNSSGFDPVAVPRRRRPQVAGQHAVGPPPGPQPLRRDRAAGIFTGRARALVGERKVIFEGTSLGLTEAPHLYKRDGWYYLLTAEGGTGWNHAATMARSRDIAGPYVLHPDTYILSSSASSRDAELQRAGHADLVETPDGQTYGGLSLRPPPAQPGALRDWAARRRSNRWSGATTAGCAPSTARACRA
jgi:xylan 1,4-beta-xylosidase